VHDTPERPSNACITCPPPREEGKPWRLADDSYVTCSGCYDKIRETLKDITKRYTALNPALGGTGESGSRGAPGFGSRPPASDHIITMTDRRSSSVARVWVGADGRVHQEPERPPLSVWSVLDGAAWAIAEERGIDGPPPDVTVQTLTRWIDNQLDWLTRNPLVIDVARDLRALVAQLRPATGETRAFIGLCPNLPENAEQECQARLYAPTKGDTIRCGACGREWARPTWERLGQMLQAGAA